MLKLFSSKTKQTVNMQETLRERIYQSIRDDITYAKLLPGERLVESGLANQFNVSRSPIRDALRQLEAEGLIKFNQNGFIVSKLSIKEVEEIYNLRLLLESYAAKLSAEQATKKQITYLRNLHKKLTIAAKNLDLMGWIQNNILFHNFFSENSGNNNLHHLLEILKRRIYRYRYTIVRIPGHFENYLKHHEGILKACERNNGKMAEKFMKLHLQEVKEVLMDSLNRFPGFS